MQPIESSLIEAVTREVVLQMQQHQARSSAGAVNLQTSRSTSPQSEASYKNAGLCGHIEVPVQVGVSVRHIHLCQEHIEILFGKGHQLNVHAELYQKGYFAAKEQLIVVGPKNSLTKVRVLGPPRAFSQVELAQTDALALGLRLPIATEGSEAGTQPVTLVGPKGTVHLPGGKGGGAFIARRHIHLSDSDAVALGVKAGDLLDLRVNGMRPTTLHGVFVRVKAGWLAEVHVDTDEANAAGIKNNQICKLIIPGKGCCDDA